MDENALSKVIVDAAFEVHWTLGGPGLLESVYRGCLAFELMDRGLFVDQELEVPIIYKGRSLETPLKCDVMVNKLVIVECKATTEFNSIYQHQLLTYLRLTNLKLGLVINFCDRLLRDGIHRVVNGL